MSLENLKQELLFELIDNMPTMAYYCTIDGICRFLNKAYIEFTGRTVEELVDFKWVGLNLVHPEDVARILAAWKDSTKNFTPYEVEYRLRSKEGEYKWVRSKAFYVKDKEGNPYAWFGNIHDIHEAKTKKEELATILEEQLQTVSPLKSPKIIEKDIKV